MPTRTPMPGDPGHGPIVRHGRNPVAMSMFGVMLLSGVIGLFDPAAASPSLTRVLGVWVWTWHVGLIIGSVTALVGVVIMKPLSDVLIERVGCIWLSSLFLAYFLIIAMVNGTFATLAGITLGLSVAFAARAWQITKDLSRLRHVLQGLPARGGPTA